MKIVKPDTYEDYNDVLMGLIVFYLRYYNELLPENKKHFEKIINSMALSVVEYEKKHLN